MPLLLACCHCETVVRRPPSAVGRRVFCSPECFHVHTRGEVRTPRKNGKPKPQTPCATCGQPVARSLRSGMSRVYCNSTCANRNPDKRRGGRAHPVGTRRQLWNGYVEERTPSGWQAQHRLVMERSVGRPLLPIENVHHRNGVRSDNRLENLELWVVGQPKGQRLDEALAWARRLVSIYGMGT